MKKFFLSAFVFFLLINLSAQITVGPEGKFRKSELLGTYSFCNNFYIHKSIADHECLTRTDEKGNEILTVALDKESKKYKGKKAAYKNLYCMNGKFVVLYECKAGKENAKYILAQQLDPEKLTGIDSLHTIIVLKNSEKFTVTLSEKGSKMLLHSHYQLLVENKSRKIMHNDVAVMDDQLNVLYTRSGPVPSGKGGEKFQWEDNAVDEKGNASVLIMEEVVSPKYGSENSVTIYSFSKDEEKTKEFSPKFPEEKRIGPALELAYYPGGSWYLVGYYSEGVNGGAAGTYFVSPYRNNWEPVFNPFPISFIGENANDKYKLWLQQMEPKGKAPGIPDLVFKKVIATEDGKLFMLAEQELMQNYTFYNLNANPDATWTNLFPMDPTQVNIRQTNITVSCLDREGKTEWNTWVLKNQDEFIFGSAFCSVASTMANGNLVLAFNDHPSSLLAETDLKFAAQTPKWGGEAVPVLTVITPNGQQSRRQLFNETFISELSLVPDLTATECKDNLLLLFRDQSSKYRLVNLKL